jgi:hypothetical protein
LLITNYQLPITNAQCPIIANSPLKQKGTNNKDVGIEDFSIKTVVLDAMLGLY